MSADLLSTLPESLVACHVAPMTTSRELVRFCMISRQSGKLETLFVRQVIEQHHGLVQVIAEETAERSFGLFELYHSLDCVQDRACFEFTLPYMAAVLKPEQQADNAGREPEFMLVDVGGGQTGYRTVAACPPNQGDYWRLLVPLRRGWYRLEVSGWRNPHHGILDLALDDQAISPAEGLDWYVEASTVHHTFSSIYFEVGSTGTHVLRGETSRCNRSALGAKYWICLEAIRIYPADEEIADEPREVLEAPRSIPRRHQAFHLRPAPAAQAARAAAVRALSLAADAARLSAYTLHLGKHAAWCGITKVAHRVARSLHSNATLRRKQPPFVCPCRSQRGRVRR